MRREFAVGVVLFFLLLMLGHFAMEGGSRGAASWRPTDDELPPSAADSTVVPRGRYNGNEDQHPDDAPLYCRMAAEASSNRPRTPRPVSSTVALCFFGLVKSVDAELVSTVNASILHPLLQEGYAVDVFLHTYRATQYVNKFNDESSDHSFNQTASIDEMRRLFADMHVLMDEFEAADRYFPLQEHLQAGDPWPFHPLESLKFFLRQQYSLLRVTEMWSGEPLVNASRQNHNCGGAPSRQAVASRYDGVIYLRPDLYMLSRLNLDAFEATLGASKRSVARRDVDANEPASCAGGAVEHPWILWRADQAPSTAHGTGKNINNINHHKRSGLHIAVPTFEWGGIHDRIAFGGPEIMFLYGARGLGLQTYVGVLHKAPHAERYLRDYLCVAGATVHIAPLWSARRRVNGQLEDDGAKLLRLQVYGKRVGIWSKWQLQQPLDRYGRGLKQSCRFASMYAYEPLAPDAIPLRRTQFKRR